MLYLLKLGGPVFYAADSLTVTGSRFDKYPVEWFGILAESAFRTHLQRMYKFNYFQEVLISTQEDEGMQEISLKLEEGKTLTSETLECVKAYMEDNFRDFRYVKLGRKVYSASFTVTMEKDIITITVTFKQQ